MYLSPPKVNSKTNAEFNFKTEPFFLVGREWGKGHLETKPAKRIVVVNWYLDGESGVSQLSIPVKSPLDALSQLSHCLPLLFGGKRLLVRWL